MQCSQRRAPTATAASARARESSAALHLPFIWRETRLACERNGLLISGLSSSVSVGRVRPLRLRSRVVLACCSLCAASCVSVSVSSVSARGAAAGAGVGQQTLVLKSNASWHHRDFPRVAGLLLACHSTSVGAAQARMYGANFARAHFTIGVARAHGVMLADGAAIAWCTLAYA